MGDLEASGASGLSYIALALQESCKETTLVSDLSSVFGGELRLSVTIVDANDVSQDDSNLKFVDVCQSLCANGVDYSSISSDPFDFTPVNPSGCSVPTEPVVGAECVDKAAQWKFTVPGQGQSVGCNNLFFDLQASGDNGLSYIAPALQESCKETTLVSDLSSVFGGELRLSVTIVDADDVSQDDSNLKFVDACQSLCANGVDYSSISSAPFDFTPVNPSGCGVPTEPVVGTECVDKAAHWKFTVPGQGQSVGCNNLFFDFQASGDNGLSY